jgi:hypothetical protein
MGMNSVRTMELADVTKYVQSLMSLGVLCIVMRVMWVVDIVLQVKKAVKDAENDDNSSSNGSNGGGGSSETPLDDQANVTLDSNTVVSFAIQVYWCFSVPPYVIFDLFPFRYSTIVQ